MSARQGGISTAETAFKLSLDAIVAMNAVGEITGWNPAAETLFGWPETEAIGRRVVDLIVPAQYRHSHESGLAKFRATGEGPVLGKVVDILTALRRDGSEFPIEIRISHAGGGTANPEFVAFVRDISARKWAERHQQTRYAVTRAIASRGSWREAVELVLEAATEQLGFVLGEAWLVDEATGRLCWDVSWSQPGVDVRPFTAASMENPIAAGEGVLGRAWTDRSGVRSDLTAEPLPRSRAAAACNLGTGLAVPILGGDAALGVVAMYHAGPESPIDAVALEVLADAGIQLGQHLERVRVEQALRAAQQRMSTELERRANTDSLTGLINRAGFDEAVHQAVAHGRRLSDHFALFMLDLDDFKAINDTHGHAAGDRVLRCVADLLRERLRDSDVVARLGGDEFAVLSAPGVSIEGARAIANSVLEAFDKVTLDDIGGVRVTPSIGIALFPAHGTDTAALLRNADAAMYFAKRTKSGHAMYRDGLPPGRGASRILRDSMNTPTTPA